MIRSTVYGLAVGDARGAWAETKLASDPELHAWKGEYRASEHLKSAPGAWTDDTALAIALASTLLDDNGFKPSNIAKAYLETYKAAPGRGYGNATKQAFQKLDSGVPWSKSGTKDAYGNGTAMRCAPIGVFFRGDVETAAAFAKLDAKITHGSLEAEEASVAVAVAVALLVNGAKLSGPNGRKGLPLLQEILQHVETSRTAQLLRTLELSLQHDTPRDKILHQIFEGGSRSSNTVATALACFFFTENYDEATLMAIKLGGDTDTTAAITGAFAGAHYGLESIPEELRIGLEVNDMVQQIDQSLILMGR